MQEVHLFVVLSLTHKLRAIRRRIPYGNWVDGDFVEVDFLLDDFILKEDRNFMRWNCNGHLGALRILKNIPFHLFPILGQK